MAGHSKWANIQHRKGAQDKKRGKIFTKLIRAITVAAKVGGGDITTNPRLRLAIDKALASNMTKDTIERAIKRGAGGLDGATMEDIVYEGYGAGGVAVMVVSMTDNRNRTVAEVRHIFTKFGGSLGTSGSVSYLFSEKGQLTFAPGIDEDKAMEVSLDAGAEDVIVHDDKSIDIITTPENFVRVKKAMIDAGFEPVNDEISKVASTSVQLDKEGSEKLLRMIDLLEDLDDVQEVFSNADMPEDVYE